ncbi:hypothetical protein B0H12DRAFT_1326905, partial [Mycena haematopus]
MNAKDRSTQLRPAQAGPFACGLVARSGILRRPNSDRLCALHRWRPPLLHSRAHRLERGTDGAERLDSAALHAPSFLRVAPRQSAFVVACVTDPLLHWHSPLHQNFAAFAIPSHPAACTFIAPTRQTPHRTPEWIDSPSSHTRAKRGSSENCRYVSVLPFTSFTLRANVASSLPIHPRCGAIACRPAALLHNSLNPVVCSLPTEGTDAPAFHPAPLYKMCSPQRVTDAETSRIDESHPVRLCPDPNERTSAPSNASLAVSRSVPTPHLRFVSSPLVRSPRTLPFLSFSLPYLHSLTLIPAHHRHPRYTRARCDSTRTSERRSPLAACTRPRSFVPTSDLARRDATPLERTHGRLAGGRRVRWVGVFGEARFGESADEPTTPYPHSSGYVALRSASCRDLTRVRRPPTSVLRVARERRALRAKSGDLPAILPLIFRNSI